jgi:two-component system CheB/CheR fusion protein
MQLPKGGTLSLSSLNEKGNLEVVFADNGVGIPPDFVEKMGKPLVTTKAKGMGLGFAICKRMVEAHMGSIYVESEVGKGTIIKVKLPVK